jgi:hypothetical protein
MAKLLSMPEHLRTDSVRKLLDAHLADRASPGYAAQFCVAYEKAMPPHSAKFILDLLARARAGDLTAVDALWVKFLNLAVTNTKQIRIDAITNIRDPDAKDAKDVDDYLEDARSSEASVRVEAPENLLRYLEDLVDEYKETKLFIGQQIEPRGSENAFSDQGDLWEDWDRLAQNIGGSAERLWRDVFLKYGSKVPDVKGDRTPGELANAAKHAHQLMLLRLEASLYRERSYYNKHGRELVAEGSIRIQIRKMIAAYRTAINTWRTELKEATGNTYFQERGLESQQLRRLIQQFSKHDDRELGWASQAAQVESELRYQTREEVRRESLAYGPRWTAVGLWVLKVATGYGTRPLAFVRTALLLWATDAFAFFLNDHFNPSIDANGVMCGLSQPHVQQWQDVLPVYGNYLVHYLYIAGTTLTSLGNNSEVATRLCGGDLSQIVLVLSTFSGYFMLGLLGALLYAQITQRD